MAKTFLELNIKLNGEEKIVSLKEALQVIAAMPPIELKIDTQTIKEEISKINDKLSELGETIKVALTPKIEKADTKELTEQTKDLTDDIAVNVEQKDAIASIAAIKEALDGLKEIYTIKINIEGDILKDLETIKQKTDDIKKINFDALPIEVDDKTFLGVNSAYQTISTLTNLKRVIEITAEDKTATGIESALKSTKELTDSLQQVKIIAVNGTKKVVGEIASVLNALAHPEPIKVKIDFNDGEAAGDFESFKNEYRNILTSVTVTVDDQLTKPVKEIIENIEKLPIKPFPITLQKEKTEAQASIDPQKSIEQIQLPLKIEDKTQEKDSEIKKKLKALIAKYALITTIPLRLRLDLAHNHERIKTRLTALVAEYANFAKIPLRLALGISDDTEQIKTQLTDLVTKFSNFAKIPLQLEDDISTANFTAIQTSLKTLIKKLAPIAKIPVQLAVDPEGSTEDVKKISIPKDAEVKINIVETEQSKNVFTDIQGKITKLEQAIGITLLQTKETTKSLSNIDQWLDYFKNPIQITLSSSQKTAKFLLLIEQWTKSFQHPIEITLSASQKTLSLIKIVTQWIVDIQKPIEIKAKITEDEKFSIESIKTKINGLKQQTITINIEAKDDTDAAIETVKTNLNTKLLTAIKPIPLQLGDVSEDNLTTVKATLKNIITELALLAKIPLTLASQITKHRGANEKTLNALITDYAKLAKIPLTIDSSTINFTEAQKKIDAFIDKIKPIKVQIDDKPTFKKELKEDEVLYETEKKLDDLKHEETKQPKAIDASVKTTGIEATTSKTEQLTQEFLKLYDAVEQAKKSIESLAVKSQSIGIKPADISKSIEKARKQEEKANKKAREKDAKSELAVQKQREKAEKKQLLDNAIKNARDNAKQEAQADANAINTKFENAKTASDTAIDNAKTQAQAIQNVAQNIALDAAKTAQQSANDAISVSQESLKQAKKFTTAKIAIAKDAEKEFKNISESLAPTTEIADEKTTRDIARKEAEDAKDQQESAQKAVKETIALEKDAATEITKATSQVAANKKAQLDKDKASEQEKINTAREIAQKEFKDEDTDNAKKAELESNSAKNSTKLAIATAKNKTAITISSSQTDIKSGNDSLEKATLQAQASLKLSENLVKAQADIATQAEKDARKIRESTKPQTEKDVAKQAAVDARKAADIAEKAKDKAKENITEVAELEKEFIKEIERLKKASAAKISSAEKKIRQEEQDDLKDEAKTQAQQAEKNAEAAKIRTTNITKQAIKRANTAKTGTIADEKAALKTFELTKKQAQKTLKLSQKAAKDKATIATLAEKDARKVDPLDKLSKKAAQLAALDARKAADIAEKAKDKAKDNITEVAKLEKEFIKEIGNLKKQQAATLKANQKQQAAIAKQQAATQKQLAASLKANLKQQVTAAKQQAAAQKKVQQNAVKQYTQQTLTTKAATTTTQAEDAIKDAEKIAKIAVKAKQDAVDIEKEGGKAEIDRTAKAAKKAEDKALKAANIAKKIAEKGNKANTDRAEKFAEKLQEKSVTATEIAQKTLEDQGRTAALEAAIVAQESAEKATNAARKAATISKEAAKLNATIATNAEIEAVKIRASGASQQAKADAKTAADTARTTADTTQKASEDALKNAEEIAKIQRESNKKVERVEVKKRDAELNFTRNDLKDTNTELTILASLFYIIDSRVRILINAFRTLRIASAKLGELKTNIAGASASVGKLKKGLQESLVELKKFGQALKSTSNFIKGLGIAIAVLLTGILLIQEIAETSAALVKLRSQLGLTISAAKQLGSIGIDIFRKGYGQTLTEVNDILGQIYIKFKDFKQLDALSLEKMTKNVITLTNLFPEIDLKRLIGSAHTLVEKFGLTTKQAFDFLAKGFQEGLNSADDFLDSVTEYGTQFSSAGASAGEFFSILKSGMQSGQLGTDKIGDTFKEFRLRILDGSEETKKGFKLLGLSVNDLTASIDAGVLSVSDVFSLVIQRLRDTESQTTKMQAGFAVLGTSYEDLGREAVEAIDAGLYSLEDLNGAMDDSSHGSETLVHAFSSLWRTIVDFAVTLFTSEAIAHTLVVTLKLLTAVLFKIGLAFNILAGGLKLSSGIVLKIWDLVILAVLGFGQELELVFQNLMHNIGEVRKFLSAPFTYKVEWAKEVDFSKINKEFDEEIAKSFESLDKDIKEIEKNWARFLSDTSFDELFTGTKGPQKSTTEKAVSILKAQLDNARKKLGLDKYQIIDGKAVSNSFAEALSAIDKIQERFKLSSVTLSKKDIEKTEAQLKKLEAEYKKALAAGDVKKIASVTKEIAKIINTTTISVIGLEAAYRKFLATASTPEELLIGFEKINELLKKTNYTINILKGEINFKAGQAELARLSADVVGFKTNINTLLGSLKTMNSIVDNNVDTQQNFKKTLLELGIGVEDTTKALEGYLDLSGTLGQESYLVQQSIEATLASLNQGVGKYASLLFRTTNTAISRMKALSDIDLSNIENQFNSLEKNYDNGIDALNTLNKTKEKLLKDNVPKGRDFNEDKQYLNGLVALTKQNISERIKITKGYYSELTKLQSQALSNFKTYADKLKNIDSNIKDTLEAKQSDLNDLNLGMLSEEGKRNALWKQLYKLRGSAEIAALNDNYELAQDLQKKRISIAKQLAQDEEGGYQNRRKAISIVRDAYDDLLDVQKQERSEVEELAQEHLDSFKEISKEVDKVALSIKKLVKEQIALISVELDKESAKELVTKLNDLLNAKPITLFPELDTTNLTKSLQEWINEGSLVIDLEGVKTRTGVQQETTETEDKTVKRLEATKEELIEILNLLPIYEVVETEAQLIKENKFSIVVNKDEVKEGTEEVVDIVEATETTITPKIDLEKIKLSVSEMEVSVNTIIDIFTDLRIPVKSFEEINRQIEDFKGNIENATSVGDIEKLIPIFDQLFKATKNAFQNIDLTAVIEKESNIFKQFLLSIKTSFSKNKITDTIEEIKDDFKKIKINLEIKIKEENTDKFKRSLIKLFDSLKSIDYDFLVKIDEKALEYYKYILLINELRQLKKVAKDVLSLDIETNQDDLVKFFNDIENLANKYKQISKEIKWEFEPRVDQTALNNLIEQVKQALENIRAKFNLEINSNTTNTTGHASGGLINGAGTSTSDSILARLSRGEFIVKAAAVKNYGVDFLHALNNMILPMPQFAMGGEVAAIPIASSNNNFSQQKNDIVDINFNIGKERVSLMGERAQARQLLNILRKTEGIQ